MNQTAGLTVAARLAEYPEISVVVLEAGLALLDDPKISEYSLIAVRAYSNLIAILQTYPLSSESNSVIRSMTGVM